MKVMVSPFTFFYRGINWDHLMWKKLTIKNAFKGRKCAEKISIFWRRIGRQKYENNCDSPLGHFLLQKMSFNLTKNESKRAFNFLFSFLFTMQIKASLTSMSTNWEGLRLIFRNGQFLFGFYWHNDDSWCSDFEIHLHL